MEHKTFERRIEPLDVRLHSRQDFSCGIESLGKFAAAVFVLAEGATVIGYYTLSSFSVSPGDLPPEVARKLPRYPNLPATLIGRLAVDAKFHKQGFGERLLIDALKRSLVNTAEIGSVAVVVEAETENAIAFYLSYGFVQLPDRPSKLFLPMKTIAPLFPK